MWTYHRAWSAWNLKVLLPGSVLGVGAGWLFAIYLSNAAIELTVGGIALIFVLYTWLGSWRRAHLGAPPAKPRRPPRQWGSVWGALSGFTSTLVQVGAPPFQIHMLPQRLDKLTLVGTTVIFFAVLNWMKVVPVSGARPIFAAQPRDLGGFAAARHRHQFPRLLAGAQNADRAILQDRLFADVGDRHRAVLAGGTRPRLTSNPSWMAVSGAKEAPTQPAAMAARRFAKK